MTKEQALSAFIEIAACLVPQFFSNTRIHRMPGILRFISGWQHKPLWHWVHTPFSAKIPVDQNDLILYT